MSVLNGLSSVVAGPAGFLTVLLAIGLLLDHDLVRERQLHGAPLTGRRLDIRALVAGGVVLLALLVITFRLLTLVS